MTENLESILNRVNKFINIDKNRSQYTKHFDGVRNQLFKILRNEDPFRGLFNGHSLQGSYGDNLKVSLPDEFDSVYVLKLPVFNLAKIQKDNANPGNVKIDITDILEKIKNEVQNKVIYEHLKKFVTKDNFLIVDKIQIWLTSHFQKVLASMNYEIIVDGKLAKLNYKRQGPAHTIKVTVENGFFYSIDFVPGLQFNEEQNVLNNSKGSWLAIPKPIKPPQPNSTSFRSSFFGQESEIIRNSKGLKNVLRMMKKFRDVHQNLYNLKSYYIKTIFLMKAKEKENNKTYWQSPISTLVIEMFDELHKTLCEKNLKYFWDKRCNMYEHFTTQQCDEMKNCVANAKVLLSRGQTAMDDSVRFKIYSIFLTSKECQAENISKPNSNVAEIENLKLLNLNSTKPNSNGNDNKNKISGKDDKIAADWRHIKSEHPEIEIVIEQKIAKQVADDVVDAIEPGFKKTKFNMEMSAKEVINSCVQFVIEEALPLSFFDSAPFKTLTSQIFVGLKMEKITSSNVMQLVSARYEDMKTKIKKILEGKLICLKVDTATSKDHGIMGVNAQLIKNKKIITISLAMLEMKKEHTAENLKLEITNILNEFEIRKCQVYSITIDSGRNFPKAVEQLMSTVENNDSAEESDTVEEFQNADILSNIKLENVASIKCAAHTLQLAVIDFLKEIDDSIVSRARTIVKHLRTPALMYKLKTAGIGKPPPLDVPNRWISTYTMLTGLLNAKEFCINEFAASKPSGMDDDDWWSSIESLLMVLEPAHCLTLKLQSRQLLFTEFLKCWLELRLEVENMATDMSKILLRHIKTQEIGLIENETMYAAMFVDPRLRRLLTKENIEAAKKHLKQIIVQLDRLRTACDTPLEKSVVGSFPSLLRMNIRQLEIEDSSSDDEIMTSDKIQRAFVEIDSYKEKRMDIDGDLLNYWDNKKYALPSLRLLAMILLAVPATQASVERAFSALQLVQSDFRSNLTEQNLSAILMLKLNKDLELN